ncbi:hypothetical protein BW730_01440 [Tessaracoccus aquimaris]|uniref:Restriction endonuclease type II-like domain-containing protein n=2 Tax=Tessaracoccus aquimaris TaxID=1332264 RepID=A0A1Q2CJY5_9ACTN|nr:hypothetical protein BW730_01440 [Tessaracoccus aquimaris]
MREDLTALFADGAVVAAREHPHLARALNSCAFRGEVIRVLPGVYALPGQLTLTARLQAACAYGAGIVITRQAAAHFTWWPELPLPDLIDAASPRHVIVGHGFRFEQRYVRPDLTMRRFGIALTAPELTVLDLIDDMGPIAIDEALKRRAVTLQRLRRALHLTRGRRGNTLRRELVEDSRDEPWSELEREAHRRLRSAGIDGWRTNYHVRAEGKSYRIDIALPDIKLGLELDGATFHDTDAAFHTDRRRDRALARGGWQIIRFTAQSLDEIEGTVLSIRQQRSGGGRPREQGRPTLRRSARWA